jgi:hypothetical protein
MLFAVVLGNKRKTTASLLGSFELPAQVYIKGSILLDAGMGLVTWVQRIQLFVRDVKTGFACQTQVIKFLDRPKANHRSKSITPPS